MTSYFVWCFNGQKKISFGVRWLNLGWDIDIALDYDAISQLYFNVGLTTDTDVKPTLGCKGRNFWTNAVN